MPSCRFINLDFPLQLKKIERNVYALFLCMTRMSEIESETKTNKGWKVWDEANRRIL